MGKLSGVSRGLVTSPLQPERRKPASRHSPVSGASYTLPSIMDSYSIYSGVDHLGTVGNGDSAGTVDAYHADGIHSGPRTGHTSERGTDGESG
jgi:hypothetical protein